MRIVQRLKKFQRGNFYISKKENLIFQFIGFGSGELVLSDGSNEWWGIDDDDLEPLEMPRLVLVDEDTHAKLLAIELVEGHLHGLIRDGSEDSEGKQSEYYVLLLRIHPYLTSGETT